MPCDHQRPPGFKMCRPCRAEYMRNYRKIAYGIINRRAERRGADRIMNRILDRLEGDLADFGMNGGSAAEIIRAIGWD